MNASLWNDAMNIEDRDPCGDHLAKGRDREQLPAKLSRARHEGHERLELDPSTPVKDWPIS